MTYIPMEIPPGVVGSESVYLVANIGETSNRATVRVTAYSSALIVADALNAHYNTEEE